jgi:hypothetical protein
MSEHDPSHPQWEIPPAETTPDPAPDQPAAPPDTATTEAAAPPVAGTSRPTRWRGIRRPTSRRGRGVVAAAVGSVLLFGGAAAGAAVAADGGGPDRGGDAGIAADDGRGRGGDRDRGD